MTILQVSTCQYENPSPFTSIILLKFPHDFSDIWPAIRNTKINCWFHGHFCFNPLTTNVPHHRETSQLISNANLLTGFYMMGNIGR